MASHAALTCKLTCKELQERKNTVIAALKELVIVRKEIADGYDYELPGTDSVIDLVTQFIKTERLCCEFFKFQFSVGDERQPMSLKITGPEGVKDFIRNEIDF
jgi:hypothetical protein